MKHLHFIKYGILPFLLLIICFALFLNSYSLESLNTRGIKGVVKKIDTGWGIEKSPFGFNKINATNLPQEFQKENLKIYCDVVILDVVGTKTWDIYASVSNCRQIE